MNLLVKTLCVAALSAGSALLAQQPYSSSMALVDNTDGGSAASGVRPGVLAPNTASAPRPFSRFALGGGISPMGVTMNATTNLNRYMNLRTVGNVFNYSVNNFTTNGFTVGAKLNLASAGTSIDFYPFPNHGFRLSPGLLFYNTNGAKATFNVIPGTSFSLNDYTYYASKTNPVMGNGVIGLHSQNPAFTMTTGWGNQLRRGNGHWSFPVEVGVAFIGKPTLDMALTSGQVCDSNGQNCVDVATNQDVQTNLQAQVAKYRNDMEPLKTYPIISFGVAYNFKKHITAVR